MVARLAMAIAATTTLLAWSAVAETITGLIRPIDGDTSEMAGVGVIRLADIDAPEMAQKCQGGPKSCATVERLSRMLWPGGLEGSRLSARFTASTRTSAG